MFDWHFGRRSDGEKSLLCTTISAYFRSVQAIREILYGLVDSDGRAAEGRRPMHTSDLLDLLTPLSVGVEEARLPELGTLFQELADGFFDEPNRAPYLGRTSGRLLMDMTETGSCAGCGWAFPAAGACYGNCMAAAPPGRCGMCSTAGKGRCTTPSSAAL